MPADLLQFFSLQREWTVFLGPHRVVQGVNRGEPEDIYPQTCEPLWNIFIFKLKVCRKASKGGYWCMKSLTEWSVQTDVNKYEKQPNNMSRDEQEVGQQVTVVLSSLIQTCLYHIFSVAWMNVQTHGHVEHYTLSVLTVTLQWGTALTEGWSLKTSNNLKVTCYQLLCPPLTFIVKV